MVLADLRRAIADGTFPPGARVQSETVAARLGVSRAPVREALRVLEAEALLVHAARQGYTVAALDEPGLIEVLGLRALLEPEAVRAGAAARGTRELDSMREALVDMGSTVADPAAVYEAERRFHFALFETCTRSRLLRMLEQLWDWSAPYLIQCGDRPDLDRHRSILTAAGEGRTEAVVDLLDQERAANQTRLGAALAARTASRAADAAQDAGPS
jgi:DNA-binding GntR family transcriptional regulator